MPSGVNVADVQLVDDQIFASNAAPAVVIPSVRFGKKYRGRLMHAVGLPARGRIGIFAAVGQLQSISQRLAGLRHADIRSSQSPPASFPLRAGLPAKKSPMILSPKTAPRRASKRCHRFGAMLLAGDAPVRFAFC